MKRILAHVALLIGALALGVAIGEYTPAEYQPSIETMARWAVIAIAGLMSLALLLASLAWIGGKFSKTLPLP